ncbi:UNKNOWN [Stylonychia lemnae]|uniref:Uncharacterized protein n=1 Tax=Stylonychia lemnae TaxID=5949 RepID=A0A078AIB7_STYLE|nr:UNKNOWN [Stylonychia lemnae]|eukprot:CDW81686.1 UNKNOWN [Stylonychia lemnae]
MSYAHLPYLYNNVYYPYYYHPLDYAYYQPYSVVEPMIDQYSSYYSPHYQYELYNYTKDRYDDYVRNKSLKELDEIKQMRDKIDNLAKQAKEKDLIIDVESRRLQKEKELVLMRLNDAKRKEEIALLEKERLEDAKRNLNLRYASIPRRNDLYPHPYFREFYGGPVHAVPPVINNTICRNGCLDAHGCSCNHGHYGHGHGCHHDHGSHTQTPMRCRSCYKEKTTYILPPIRNSLGGSFSVTKLAPNN